MKFPPLSEQRLGHIIQKIPRFFSNKVAVPLREVQSESENNAMMAAASEVRQQRQSLRNFGWIGKLTPCYGISGNNVAVIADPKDFYNKLKEEAQNAKKRICLASLYLGTGKLEKEMVECLREAVNKSSDPDFKLTVLLDYTRGSRGAFSSRSMFLPMMREFGDDRVQLALYHTPNLRGFWKNVLPDRFNETIGVSHLKVYLFDDNLILSGANLSDSYFTNRQDRYVLIKDCPQLADFFHGLVDTVSSMSFRVLPDNSEVMFDPTMPHPYTEADGGENFKSEAQKRILDYVASKIPQKSIDFREQLTIKSVSELAAAEQTVDDDDSGETSGIDTWVYPLIQMGPLGIKDDEIVTRVLMSSASAESRLYLASGYFNLTSDYMNVILNNSKAKYDIIMASPQVNGFYGAKGLSGAIPDAYTYIAKNFYERVCSLGQTTRVELYEYYRDKWTFHVKGLWYYLPGQTLPTLTLIGSPNFGYRSVYRDLEAQIALVTCNKQLQLQLKQEHVKMQNRSLRVDNKTFEKPERYIPVWVTYVTDYIKTFF
ncbi:CDP-diacylglycerol--glycerol-3-phosphate 3-phosphatidyltransferase, mitochondrial-like [Tubulanus polymorphus]|uniref:CDP-diacylglycerol--glycerol-3-phosphate 3-phosphatidyltransferase, mitochondrial-like n=1 Tax=Tubulanus polymorphus TaxID=672921 RepID=UPI003DA6CBCB